MTDFSKIAPVDYDTGFKNAREHLKCDRALEALQLGVYLSFIAEDDESKFDAYTLQAECFDKLGAPHIENQLYRRIIRDFSNIDNKSIVLGRAWASYNLGFNLSSVKEFESSKEAYEKAINLAQSDLDFKSARQLVMQARYNLATDFANRDLITQAVAQLEENLSVGKDADSNELLSQVGRSASSLAHFQMSEGNYKKAKKAFSTFFALPASVLSSYPEYLKERMSVSQLVADFEDKPTNDAIVSLHNLFEKHRNSSDDRLKDVAAFALFNYALFLDELERTNDAVDAFRELISCFSDVEESSPMVSFAEKFVERASARDERVGADELRVS